MTAGNTCADHEPEMSALLDAQLPEPAASRLRAHLSHCPGCLAELEGLRRARSMLRSLPVRAVPSGLLTQSAVEGRLAGHSAAAERQPTSRSPRPLVAVLIAAVAGVLTMVLLTGGGEPDSLITVDFQGLADRYVQTVGGEAVPIAGERLVVEWLDGPDRPALVSRSTLSSQPQGEEISPVDLSGKYDVVVGEPERIMDRRCVRMDVRMASTGELREQVWMDEASGVFLRRETYTSGERTRTVAYLSLDLNAPSPLPGSTPPPLALTRPSQLAALRAAGWTAPPQLAGGYLLAEVMVEAWTPGMPLQAIYSDGLYTVSLFVQPGQPDVAKLPPDATPMQELSGHRAYALTGLPAGIVWGADGHSMTLLGDAPQDDLLAIAGALPVTPSTRPLARLGRGIGRLVGFVAGD